jgi:hypothetical protein
MEDPPRSFLISRAPQDASGDWRGKVVRLTGAIVIHLLPLTLLVFALPLKPKTLGGTFGQSVAVTLVSGTPGQAASSPPQPNPNQLSNLERRLSDRGLTVAEPVTAAKAAAPTRLSDLFDAQTGVTGQAPTKGPQRPTAGADDDPFARASVSYRGDDPQKSARLQSKAQACARGTRTLRVLLIINAEGYLVARPRSLSTSAPDKATLKAISAIERCAPFADAATPGPPRSYEIDIG